MIILVIVLVLFGAKRVPEIGASIGKGIREFKRSVNDMDRSIREPDAPAPRERLSAGEPGMPSRTEEAEREPKRLI
jgi:sec-independent protein translocase protein TatA